MFSIFYLLITIIIQIFLKIKPVFVLQKLFCFGYFFYDHVETSLLAKDMDDTIFKTEALYHWFCTFFFEVNKSIF